MNSNAARLDRLERDLKELENHVQHIAATLVAIVETAQAADLELARAIENGA